MEKIVILTGAGISAESGLGTFRDEGGLWAQHAIEDVATPEGFARDPGLVHRFYNARRAQSVQATPNPAHEALARLQAGFHGDLWIVTQNVDDLHEKAGSSNVLHMHGSLSGALCGPAIIAGPRRLRWRRAINARIATRQLRGLISCGSARCPITWNGSGS